MSHGTTHGQPEPSPTARSGGTTGIMDDVMEQMRTLVRDTVRSRVAGPDGDAVRAELEAAPGDGWFEADHPVRIVHSDVATFVGGLRALLLQSLHPLAMAGVAEHSDYRQDPWGRLQRTAEFLARTTFGNAEQAEAACARVRAVHRHVQGTAADGRPYSANDPHLLEWVHLAEVDSFLVAHQRYGAHRLDAAARDGYVHGMAKVAAELGVVEPPHTEAEVRQRLRRYLPELRPTPQARAGARFLLAPPMPAPARVPYLAVFAAGASLLPWWAKLGLRLPPLVVSEPTLVRPAASAVLGLVRWSAD